jgi:hypothetical protein
MKLIAAPFLFLILVIYAGPLSAQDAGISRSKCGFPAFTDRFERAKGNLILRKKIAAAPALETSILSPSGHFRIHFDTSRTSPDLPALLDAYGQRRDNTQYQYIDSVARIFDHVWDVEIGVLGFPAPPSDNGEGGGNEYDIYVQSMTDFGSTDFVDPGTIYPGEVAPRYPSHISIDCDFGIGFRTKGLAGARVTAAHEFFHAIQVGGYGWWDTPERYFYELTAESMESAVYPEVRDYIYDAPSYFSSINQMSLTQNVNDFGYGRAVWGIYFRLKYGIEFIRAAWEKVRLQRPPLALLKTVEQYGSTMRKEISEFALWCYYTNARADSVHYFPDAKYLPGVKLADSIWLASPSYSRSTTCASYTIQYVWLKVALDTAVCVVVNANSDDATAHAGGVFLFILEAGQQSGSEWKQMSSSMNFRLTVNDPSQWNAFSLSNGTWMPLVNARPYPDPFHPGTGHLAFPLPSSVVAPVEVTILDAAMQFVNQWEATPQSQMGIWEVLWDGRDFRRNLVSSGVYFYFIQSNNYQQQGKIAVLR